MARAHRVLVYASAFLIIYVLAFFVSIPLVKPDLLNELLPVIPWWLLVSFGAYSLASLGWGLFTFQDCPGAYQELLREVNDAKNDLRAKGVTVD